MLQDQSPSEDYKSSVLPEKREASLRRSAALKISAEHLNPRFMSPPQASSLKYTFGRAALSQRYYSLSLFAAKQPSVLCFRCHTF